MRTYERCIPCLMNQTYRVAELSTDDRQARSKIMCRAVSVIGKFWGTAPPPVVAQTIYRVAREVSGNPDPYLAFKAYSKRLVVEIFPQLRKMIEQSSNPFRTATLLSLAGNVIDFAPDYDIQLLRSIQKVTGTGPLIDCVPDLQRSVEDADDVLFVGDNAGEVLLDRLMIEAAPGNARFYYAVRGKPVINDATVDDAIAAGIHKFANVLSTGSDAPGVVLEDCSNEFRSKYKDANVVIAKGMGNYESLCDEKSKEIYFLLLVKCAVVAKHVGCKVGESVVLKKSKGVAFSDRRNYDVDRNERDNMADVSVVV